MNPAAQASAALAALIHLWIFTMEQATITTPCLAR